MKATNERGSALIIALMLLLILTAIGIYAVSISTTEMDIALNSKVGTSVLNAAEAGANYGVDQVPAVFTTEYAPPAFPDHSQYRMTSRATETLSIRPGYGSNFRFADFEVTSRGESTGFVAHRTVQAVVTFGPVPVGTMY